MRFIDAIDRSHEDKAAYVVKKGGLTQGIVTVQFFDESNIYVDVERMGSRPERYIAQGETPREAAQMLMVMLTKLLPMANNLGVGWEPV